MAKKSRKNRNRAASQVPASGNAPETPVESMDDGHEAADADGPTAAPASDLATLRDFVEAAPAPVPPAPSAREGRLGPPPREVMHGDDVAVGPGDRLAIGSAGGDLLLEEDFFRRGLSVDALVAQDREEQDREERLLAQPRRPRAGLVVGGVGFALVLALIVGSRMSAHTPAPSRETAPATASSGAPPAAATPTAVAPGGEPENCQAPDRLAALLGQATTPDAAAAADAEAVADPAASLGEPASAEEVPAVADMAAPEAVEPVGAAVPAAPAPAPVAAASPDERARAVTSPATANAESLLAKQPPPAGHGLVAAVKRDTATETAQPAAHTSTSQRAPAALDATPAVPPAAESCRAAYEQRRFAEALNACGRALEATAVADKDGADLAAIMAHAAVERGQMRQARNWAEKAISAAPDNALAYMIIGMAEQERGNTRAARQAYQRYLELAPRGRYAQELRAILATL